MTKIAMMTVCVVNPTLQTSHHVKKIDTFMSVILMLCSNDRARKIMMIVSIRGIIWKNS